MIRSAIGRPRPNVPRIVSANAVSIFDAGGELRTNMTLCSFEPPRASWINDQTTPPDQAVTPSGCDAGCYWDAMLG